jgi:hypothetical protein
MIGLSYTVIEVPDIRDPKQTTWAIALSETSCISNLC